MSTIELVNKIKFSILNADQNTLPMVDFVNLALKIQGTSIVKIAALAGVSRQAAYADLNGKKPCPRFRKKLISIVTSYQNHRQ